MAEAHSVITVIFIKIVVKFIGTEVKVPAAFFVKIVNILADDGLCKRHCRSIGHVQRGGCIGHIIVI